MIKKVRWDAMWFKENRCSLSDCKYFITYMFIIKEGYVMVYDKNSVVFDPPPKIYTIYRRYKIWYQHSLSLVFFDGYSAILHAFTIHLKNIISFLNKVTENDRLIVFEILFSSVYYKFVINCIKHLITFLYFKISQAMQHDRLIVFQILFPLVYYKFVTNCIKHLNTFLYFKISQAMSYAISFLPVSDCKPTSVRVCDNSRKWKNSS